jgi:hypothetical protein
LNIPFNKLLQATGLDCWNNSTQIIPERLSAWPEEGNLVNLTSITRVDEDDCEHSEFASSSSSTMAPPGESEAHDTELNNGGLYQDGNDLGPAPLQAALAPEETFEGTESIDTNANAPESAVESEAMLERFASHLMSDSTSGAASLVGAASSDGTASGRSHSRTSTSGGTTDATPVLVGTPHPRLIRGGTAAQLPQTDLFPRGNFVHMRKTPYAWHRAFPTVFPPWYVNG